MLDLSTVQLTETVVDAGNQYSVWCRYQLHRAARDRTAFGWDCWSNALQSKKSTH